MSLFPEAPPPRCARMNAQAAIKEDPSAKVPRAMRQQAAAPPPAHPPLVTIQMVDAVCSAVPPGAVLWV